MASHANGSFVWYENLAKDPKGAISFYGEVVGWKTEPFGSDGYTMWVGSQGPLGGVMELPEKAAQAGAPPHWMSHVQVTDVEATMTKAKSLGGKVLMGPENVPTVGRFAILADPQGGVLSVFKPEKPMEAHDSARNGEFCWSELLAKDSQAALTYYSELFGWNTLQEMDMGPMGKYRIFGIGETRLGGMMDIPKGQEMPTAWLYYINVDDLDASIARATKMGAKICNGPMEVPGGARIAQLSDPQGCMFALHTPPKKG